LSTSGFRKGHQQLEDHLLMTFVMPQVAMAQQKVSSLVGSGARSKAAAAAPDPGIMLKQLVVGSRVAARARGWLHLQASSILFLPSTRIARAHSPPLS
jgi:hypothetical protein